MLALVDAAIRIERDAVPVKLLERLRRALSFPNPAFIDRLRLGLSPGDEPEELCFLCKEGDDVRLPRGAVHLLLRLATRDHVDLVFQDRRSLPPVLDNLPAVSLRDYQQCAVTKLETITQGTVIIPCGGGKTRVGIGAIAMLKTPTLILVHTLDLAAQWLEEAAKLLGTDIGIIGGGEDNRAPITVAVIQSLMRWGHSRLDDFLNGFGLLILDEAHHVAASTFHGIVDRCPARFRLGLTATPDREDGLTPLLELFIGRPLVQVDHDLLIKVGALALPEIRMVETEFDYPYLSTRDYAPMMSALSTDKPRNDLIIDTVAAEARQGHSCLVLSGRVAHCKVLAAGIRKRGLNAASLTGQVAKAQRKTLLDQARIGELQVLTATSLADEGLDLPRLSRVFLAYPGRARGRTIQRLGRLMRPHPDKADAVLVDFVDRKVPILRRQHLERRRLYAEILGIPASTLRRQISPLFRDITKAGHL